MLIFIGLFIAILVFWWMKSPQSNRRKSKIVTNNFIGFVLMTLAIITSAFVFDFSSITHQDSTFLQSMAGQVSFSKDLASSLGNDLLEATVLIGIWLFAIMLHAIGFAAFAIWDLIKGSRRAFA
ncbi:hypothetical protein R9C00_05110 [Flammeovirgaceae bacterium SG7u.111]|nr:hypothetical protein [Flammeovirgaceae bacterium SG7u.132]WPO36824.1 hypothetical protein R9C00_05110 [Flammeovirgaceae bacterium SG7u.111]